MLIDEKAILAAVELFIKLAVLLLAGLAAGFINSISAAGSLISLSAFMFTGLTGAQANATNRVAILIQNLASMAGFKSKGLKTEPYMAWLALATVPGAVIGAWFALKIPDYIFTKILMGVMALFLVITLFNPLKNIAGRQPILTTNRKLAGLVIYFFIGLYGGFIQAGSGFFLMAGCLLLHRFDIIRTNYYKAVIMFTYTIAAFLVFLFKGNISWLPGLVMSAGMAIGAFAGSRWSINADQKAIKAAMVIILIAFMVYLGFFK